MWNLLVSMCCLSSAAQSPDLDALAERLASDNPQTRRAAAGDLLNGEFRAAPPEALMQVLIAHLNKPLPTAVANADGLAAQSFVMDVIQAAAAVRGDKAPSP